MTFTAADQTPALATRERLLEAALDVFAAAGVAEARMEDIAAAAGVSRQALYYHFHSRTELVHALFRRSSDELTAELTQALQDRPVEYAVEVLLRSYERNAQLARLLVTELPAQLALDADATLLQSTLDVIERRLAAGVASGEIRPLDPSVTARTILGAINVHIFVAAVTEQPVAAESLRDELTTFVRNAITKPGELAP